ncbi:MAG: IS5 family transposase [Candidatus Acidiferrales bacterium]
MQQATFASLAFAAKKKQTRRERFLAEMEQVVPWDALVALIAPHYPASGRRGRPPMLLLMMLKLHCLQQWYGLSDPALEDALYEIESMRRFAGIELNETAIPDETTLLKFRRRLERHGLAVQMLAVVNAHLSEQGLLLREGTIVDATIIHAAPSTKNRDKARDPEMHQTKKGQQWYFGMKAHIGVDRDSGLVHTVVGTAANVSDVTQTAALLHGQEQVVHGDAGYTGADKREELQGKALDWNIAEKRGTVKALPDGELKQVTEELETLKATVRARVEHPFRVVKCQFGHVKVRYRGLAKNTAQLITLFALSNLWMARGRLLALTG